MKYIITLLMGFTLMACGGDSNEDNATPSDPPPSTPPSPSPSPESATTMQDLVVPDGFSYNPVKQSSLSVDIRGVSSQRAHLSVYKTFQEDSKGNYIANYSSKVVSIPLTEGQANFNFHTSDSQGPLLVEIWFYDGSAPIRKVISTSETHLTL